MTITEQPQSHRIGDPDPYIGACPSWCWDAEKGHELELSPDDRIHDSAPVRIELPLMDLVVTDDGQDRFVVPWEFDVQLEQRDRDAQPFVAFTVNERHDVRFRLQDARELRDVLTSLLEQAEAGR